MSDTSVSMAVIKANKRFVRDRSQRSKISSKRFRGRFHTGDTNGSTRVETGTRQRWDDRRNLYRHDSFSRSSFSFIWKSACTRSFDLFSFFLSTMNIMERDRYPLTYATNLSPREAELIRIRMPDTYFNTRAYVKLFKMCMEEGENEWIKGEGKETAKSRVNKRKKEVITNDRRR